MDGESCVASTVKCSHLPLKTKYFIKKTTTKEICDLGWFALMAVEERQEVFLSVALWGMWNM